MADRLGLDGGAPAGSGLPGPCEPTDRRCDARGGGISCAARRISGLEWGRGRRAEQLFFDDALSDQVFTQAPYASKGQRDTRNSNDNIYKDLLLLTVTKTGQGYATTFPIGVDVSTLGTGQSGNGGGPGGPPPGGPRPGATATATP